MKLFFYYALHTVKNQLKKLFKTWVLIFLVACMVIGGLIGMGAAKISELSGGDETPDQTETVIGDTLPEGEDAPFIEIETEDAEAAARTRQIVELAAGGIILALLIYEVMSADKNGSKIFLPADVNLLFASPMRPQSVLMFRLMTQLGMAVFASVYLLFQLPNLMLNLGLSLWAGLAVIATWCLTIVVGKLIQTLLYIFCSTRPGAKAYLRRGVYVLLALIVLGYFAAWKTGGQDYFPAAVSFFNAPLSRYIPVWGWLKGITVFAVEGSVSSVLLCVGGVCAVIAVLLVVIRRMKADFYEDAMAKSEEMAELLERAQSEKSSGLVFAKRKKDRSEALRRDGLRYGAGANVFFFKSLYNRFRFAHLGLFTKTTEMYLVAAVGTALLCTLVFQTRLLIPAALVLAVFAFYRTLGNPLAQDTRMDYFRLVPESTWAKLFWSLLGGTVNCLLDVLPAMLAAVLILRANPLEALAWVALIVSVDFYGTNVGTFINLSVPVNAGKTIKQVVQIMFLYFGLLPDIAIMAVALATKHTATGILASAAANVVLGLLFFALSPLFLTPGGNRAAAASALSEADSRRAGKTFSRLGVSAAVILLTASLLQAGLAALLNAVAPDWGIQPWGMWAVTFAPLYLIAVPLGLLIARGVPAAKPAQSRLGAGRYIGIIFISIFLMWAGNLVGGILQSVISGITGRLPVNPIEAFAMDDSLVLRVLFLVILAPLIEEFVFRKTLIDRMRPYGEKLAVVTSAVMFSLFHGNISQMCYAFTLGLVLGYVYLRTGRLRYSVGIHMGINLFNGVVSAELLRRAMPDPSVLEKLMGMDSSALAEIDPNNVGDMTAVLQEMMGSFSLEELITPGVIAFGAYSLALFLCAVAGLVLLCIRGRRVHFDPAPLQIPRSRQFQTVYLNFGMILFVLLCLTMVVSTFLR